ncbi:MAG TPA: vitamin K epoxide reductase family protein [Solirubrobacteraceae bacterium]|nr:vitamin K epoxide reductase family protein [Solirubrobacteraceae bacterium]
MSTRVLRLVMIAIAMVGLGVASYLTYVHYAGGPILCLKGGGCETVQHSTYSKLVGVPVALIGLIGYIVILASLLVPESETTRLSTMTFTVMGFGFSLYLTARELFSIHAICPWCVSSAVMMTLLVCLAVWRFLRGDAPPTGALLRPSEPDSAAPLTAPGS